MIGGVRLLPVHVEPVPAETLESYMRRLATAHAVSVGELRQLVAAGAGQAHWSRDAPSVVRRVEEMAGLEAGALEIDPERHGRHVRCGHHSWRPTLCLRCRRLAPPRLACAECSAGTTAMTVAAGGPICIRHRTWSHEERCALVDDVENYLRAEETMRHVLWGRGVTLHSGELQLAAAFVAAWLRDQPASDLPERLARSHQDDATTFASILWRAYPEIIRVATVLVNGRLVAEVLDLTRSPFVQAPLLERAVMHVLPGHQSVQLADVVSRTVQRGHRAVLYSYGLRRTRNAKHVACPLDKALIVASHRQRACLLRHANPARMDPFGWHRTDGAPPTRVVRRWELVPDDGLFESEVCRID